MVGRWRRSTNYCPGHGLNTAKPALRHDQICHQFGGSASEISCASLGIGEDLIADHAHRHLMKVGLQSLVPSSENSGHRTWSRNRFGALIMTVLRRCR